MATAKTIQLIARPGRSANLSFEIGGIVLESHAVLGQQVLSFDFPSFYQTLGVATESAKPPPAGTMGGPPDINSGPFTPYLYNSSDLDSSLERSGLMRLRAEPIKAVLDKTCVARANLYISKYGFIDQIKAVAQDYYTGAAGKGMNLYELRTLAAQQADALANAYAQDSKADLGVDGVVRQSSDTTGTSTTTFDPYVTTTTEKASYAGSPYRHPFIEALAQHYRARVSLNDEMFANFLTTLSVNDLDEVLSNELSAVDQDVKRVQAAYMSTILFSPISGTITGIYKRVGEAVGAGEPVLRVENNDTINIAGSIVYSDVIALSDDVTINTTLFGVIKASLSGVVTAARCVGGSGGDNRWYVVFACDNRDASGNHIVPDNYSFSDVDTTVNFA